MAPRNALRSMLRADCARARAGAGRSRAARSAARAQAVVAGRQTAAFAETSRWRMVRHDKTGSITEFHFNFAAGQAKRATPRPVSHEPLAAFRIAPRRVLHVFNQG